MSEMDNQQARPVKYKNQLSKKYLIYPNCEIYSLYTNKFLKKSYTRDGYLKFILVEFEGKPTVLGHRVLMESFLEDFDSSLQVNHKDGDKKNNNLSNLEMVTPKQNSIHAIKTGLSKIRKGEGSGNDKLNSEQVQDICRLLIFTALYDREIAERFGVVYQTIGSIRSKNTWSHISDFYWTGKLQRLSRKGVRRKSNF